MYAPQQITLKTPIIMSQNQYANPYIIAMRIIPIHCTRSHTVNSLHIGKNSIAYPSTVNIIITTTLTSKVNIIGLSILLCDTFPTNLRFRSTSTSVALLFKDTTQ